jgi:chromosome partitioning protein
MPVTIIGSTKGGAGKSTLALNITVARANAGRSVLLIDGDEQKTAMTFTDLRVEQSGQAGYTAVSLLGVSVRNQGRQLAAKYDDVIIDVGGRDTGSLRAALTIADTVLIPVLPRSVDIWALDQMTELVIEAREINDKLKALVVLNQADPAGRENSEALEIIGEVKDLVVLPFTIGRRKAFSNATGSGKAVTEYLPKDPKAIGELEKLLEALYPKKMPGR